MKQYTPAEWHDLADNIYQLILTQFDDPNYIREKHKLYINMVYAVNFFRMIRGEAFNQSRPPGMGELQQDLYRKEDELMNKLSRLKQEINLTDPAAVFHLKQATAEFI